MRAPRARRASCKPGPRAASYHATAVTALADLEAALAARWDREQLAVYADYLQAQGDPRGELIAIDLFAAAHGASAELAARKRSVVEGWLGVELAARVLAAGVIEDGFVDLRTGSLDDLRDVLASAAGPYLRSLAIGGNHSFLPAAVELLASAPRRWLRRLAVRRLDDYPERFVIDDATSAALIAASPSLDALEVRGYWVFGELAHPHLRRLRVTCLTALGSLLGEGPPLTSASELDFAFELEDEEDLAELDRIFPCCRLPALRCLDLSRNEPGKGTSIGDHEAALSLLPRLPIRTQLTHLRLPSLRSNDQLDQLERAVGDMPSVVEVRIARAYGGIPLRSPRSPIDIASRRPWPPADLEVRALHIPGDSKHRLVFLQGAITLMEETFDALPEAAREVWTVFWELAGEHGLDTIAPFRVPSHLLSRALDAIPSDALSQYEDWAEMREALRRDTCPPTLGGHS